MTIWKMLSDTGMRKIRWGNSVVKIANFDGVELWGIKWYDNTATSFFTICQAIEPIKNFKIGKINLSKWRRVHQE